MNAKIWASFITQSMATVKSYFDSHAHHHAYHRHPSTYLKIVDHLKRTCKREPLRILDVGCGDGSFILALKSFGIQGSFYGIDLSKKMLDAALTHVDGDSSLVVADGFRLPLQNKVQFDVIHLDCVLHHLIRGNIEESRRLAHELLLLLYKRLSKNGLIVVEEMYYNSYLFPSITARIIFYGLKLIKKCNLDLSRIRSEFQPGLEVNFFSVKDLEGLFAKHSREVTCLSKDPAPVPKLYRIFLLRALGKISYSIGN